MEGDSAFGFSGMEVETAARYELPIICLIFNNSGIGFGVNKETWEGSINSAPPTLSLPPVALKPGTRYDLIAPAFGCKGYCVKTPEELERTLTECLSNSEGKQLPVIVNIEINPVSSRKPQEHSWLTKSNL